MALFIAHLILLSAISTVTEEKAWWVGMSNTRLWDLNDLITRHHQCRRSIPLHKRSISIPRTEQGHIADDKLVPILETKVQCFPF